MSLPFKEVNPAQKIKRSVADSPSTGMSPSTRCSDKKIARLTPESREQSRKADANLQEKLAKTLSAKLQLVDEASFKDCSKVDPNIENSLFEESLPSKVETFIKEDVDTAGTPQEPISSKENKTDSDASTMSISTETVSATPEQLLRNDPNIENTLFEASNGQNDVVQAKQDSQEKFSHSGIAEIGGVSGKEKGFGEEQTIALFHKYMQPVYTEGEQLISVQEAKNVDNAQIEKATDTSAVRRESLTILKDNAVASRVPEKKSKLLNASDLLHYSKMRLEEYSFLIDEHFCDTSTLCTNCCALKSDLEVVTTKLEALVDKAKELNSTNSSFTSDTSVDRDPEVLAVLLEEKDAALITANKEREELFARCDELQKQVASAIQDAEGYKCTLEMQTEQTLEQLDSLRRELAAVRRSNDQYQIAYEKLKNDYDTLLTCYQAEKDEIIANLKLVNETFAIAIAVLKKANASEMDHDLKIKASERAQLSEKSKNLLNEIRAKTCADSSPSTEIHFDGAIYCVELMLNTILGNDSVDECIEKVLAKNKEMQHTVGELRKENAEYASKISEAKVAEDSYKNLISFYETEVSFLRAKEMDCGKLVEVFTSTGSGLIEVLHSLCDKLIELANGQARETNENSQKQEKLNKLLEAVLVELTASQSQAVLLSEEKHKNAQLIEEIAKYEEKSKEKTGRINALELDIESNMKTIARLGAACDDADDECQQLREQLYAMRCEIARLECEKEGVMDEKAVVLRVGGLPAPKLHSMQKQSSSGLPAPELQVIQKQCFSGSVCDRKDKEKKIVQFKEGTTTDLEEQQLSKIEADSVTDRLEKESCRTS